MALPIKSLLGQSALFDLSPIELPDGVEHRLYYCYSLLERAWFGKEDEQLTIAVLQQASKGREAYAEVVLGLLYGILAFPSQRQTVLLSRYCDINVHQDFLVFYSRAVRRPRWVAIDSRAVEVFHI